MKTEIEIKERIQAVREKNAILHQDLFKDEKKEYIGQSEYRKGITRTILSNRIIIHSLEWVIN